MLVFLCPSILVAGIGEPLDKAKYKIADYGKKYGAVNPFFRNFSIPDSRATQAMLSGIAHVCVSVPEGREPYYSNSLRGLSDIPKRGCPAFGMFF
ncbi:hypothetical protein [Desulfonema ishimotonii]|uniref:hypothetical protein n=1 Tax=Desulfonema ishimotonii TaxID=45657 RepID=UPI000F574615|nr:hypothetical protein [Desulfonema ishimotonii]